MTGSLVTVLPNMFSNEELDTLERFTQKHPGKANAYGRLTCWCNQQFMVGQLDKKHEMTPIINKLTEIFLNQLNQQGFKYSKDKLTLDSHVDRVEAKKDEGATGSIGWHQDHILVGTKKKVSDYTLVVLFSKNDNRWTGGELLIRERNGNKKDPVYYQPCYNQGVFFRNNNTEHKVTAVIPQDDNVHRDIVVITCHLSK